MPAGKLDILGDFHAASFSPRGEREKDAQEAEEFKNFIEGLKASDFKVKGEGKDEPKGKSKSSNQENKGDGQSKKGPENKKK